jgi:hypothetical protein
LLADLHQPLHVGRVKDHGGVAISLVSPRDNTLHDVWDSYLLKDFSLESLVDPAVELEHMLRVERERMKTIWPSKEVLGVDEVVGLITEWVIEVVADVAQAYTIPFAYKNEAGGWITDGDSLSKEYLSSRSDFAKHLVRLGGVRTALVFNRLARFLRDVELGATPVSGRPPPSTHSPPNSNMYDALVIEEIDFVPEDLIEREEEVVVVEAPRRPVAEPIVFQGVTVSALALFKIGDDLEVRPRAKGKRGWCAAKPYEFSFPRNTAENKIIIFFDLDCFGEGVEVTDSLLVAILYHIRGAGVSRSLSHAAGGLLSRNPAPISRIQRGSGVFRKLPIFLTRNIHQDGLLPESRVKGPCSGDEFEGINGGEFRLTQDSEDRRGRVLGVQREIAKRRFPAIPDTSARLAALNVALLERNCNSVVHVRTNRVLFFTTESSLTNSRSRASQPMKAGMYEVRGRSDIASVIWLVDTNLLQEGLLSAANAGLLVDCGCRNAFDFLSVRPTLVHELYEIDDLIADPDKPGQLHIINQVMLYPAPGLGGEMPIVEWNIHPS